MMQLLREPQLLSLDRSLRILMQKLKTVTQLQLLLMVVSLLLQPKRPTRQLQSRLLRLTKRLSKRHTMLKGMKYLKAKQWEMLKRQQWLEGEDDTQKVVVETTTASAEGVASHNCNYLGRIETGDSLKLNITGGRNENVSEFITLVAGQSYLREGLDEGRWRW